MSQTPQLYIAKLLSRHIHTKGRDKESKGISLNISLVETCTDIPECMLAEEIRYALQTESHLNALTEYVING